MANDPWEGDIPGRYQPGEVKKGKVTKLTNFGVFVELEPGLEGLLHISELADHKVESPEDVVKVGDEIEVKILRVDAADRKIGLSRKRLELEPEDGRGRSRSGRSRSRCRRPSPQREAARRHRLAAAASCSRCRNRRRRRMSRADQSIGVTRRQRPIGSAAEPLLTARFDSRAPDSPIARQARPDSRSLPLPFTFARTELAELADPVRRRKLRRGC